MVAIGAMGSRSEEEGTSVLPASSLPAPDTGKGSISSSPAPVLYAPSLPSLGGGNSTPHPRSLWYLPLGVSASPVCSLNPASTSDTLPQESLFI